jgi:hypothetical protein
VQDKIEYEGDAEWSEHTGHIRVSNSEGLNVFVPADRNVHDQQEGKVTQRRVKVTVETIREKGYKSTSSAPTEGPDLPWLR